MAEEVRIEDFLTTKKQKEFEYDFFQKADEYETWDNVDFEKVYEGDRTFTVEAEDIKFFSEGCLDENPLFNTKRRPRPARWAVSRPTPFS